MFGGSSGSGGDSYSKQYAAREEQCCSNQQLHDQLGLLLLVKEHASVLQLCLHNLLLE
jgi:hypothetical protein